jgi:hypothetical protein
MKPFQQRKLPFTLRRLMANRANVAKARAVPKEVMYRPTPKRLAANRANIRKARAVPKEVMYRLTAKRLAACRANLERANTVPQYIRYRPTERRRASALANLARAYAAVEAGGGRFRHGLFCMSLRQSLRRAGETPRTFAAHLSRFERAFAPENEAERTLLRHAAETAWRRLRAYHALAQWQARHLAQLLSRAVQVEPSEPTDGAEAHILAFELQDTLTSDAPVAELAFRLSKRLERLLRVFLWSRFGDDPHFRMISQTRWNEFRLLNLPGSVANNPFIGARQVEEWEQKRVPSGSSPAPTVAAAFRPPHAPVTPGVATAFRTRPGEVRPPSSRLRGLKSKRECVRLFERAFFAHVLPASRSAPVAVTFTPPPAHGAPGVAAAFPTRPGQVRPPHDSIVPEDRKLVRTVAGTAWARLLALRKRARSEAAKLKRILKQAALAPPPTPEQARHTAQRIVELFADDPSESQAALKLDLELVRLFQELLKRVDEGAAAAATRHPVGIV